MIHTKFVCLLLAFLCLGLFVGCKNGEGVESKSNALKKKEKMDYPGMEKAYFASGCFWCVEAIFESVIGVKEATSGYAGGDTENPTYSQVGTGTTGHTETVEVYYHPSFVSYETLVKVFYGTQDPTTVGQHPDYGPQYRSVIFYQNEEEKQIAERYKAELEASGKYEKPIVTEIVPLKKFWVAEDYHQDYVWNNPDQPYVKNVSIPRLQEFREAFPELLNEAHGSR